MIYSNSQDLYGNTHSCMHTGTCTHTIRIQKSLACEKPVVTLNLNSYLIRQRSSNFPCLVLFLAYRACDSSVCFFKQSFGLRLLWVMA